MRKVLSASLLMLASASSAATSFDARVVAAEAAIARPGGFAYDTALVPAIHAAVAPCVPAGSDPARGGGFVLVADVDAQGRLHAVDVRPASPIARCFAQRFGAMRLHGPPGPASRTWPILVRMQTHR
ncbi:hypothetical protein [Cognatilysobacter segetis]|uniref:hypothetical protein n=1 Tax=Cognatilysobacter segetis TaxID=2492394 RepID=UPI00105BF416|nr:hypothetical protein [Lysobacter segetis]